MTGTIPVSVLVAVRNEAKNIGKCLASLAWADEVVVVDSFSTDGTQRLAQELGAQVIQFEYRGGYPKKRQWALDNFKFRNEWVLLLDADEEVTPALAEEISIAIRRQDFNAWYIVKHFHFLGRRFRYGGFSHAAVLLVRLGKARFETLLENDPSGFDMEVHERMHIEGGVGTLRHRLIHQDFKGLSAYLERHNRYSTWEAQIRMNQSMGAHGQGEIDARLFGNPQERRRFLKRVVNALPFEGALWFFYHYFFRFGFLEGRAGLIAAQIRRAHFENVRAKLFELKLRQGKRQ